MDKIAPKGKYKFQVLCISSLVYLFAGLIALEKDFYLSILLFLVAVFSIMYHRNFKNFDLKIFDWVFGMTLFLYLLYFVGIKFDAYIFAFLVFIVAFRLLDHVLFKEKRYGIFSYTHSLWHLLSGLAIIFLLIFK
jgi:hypothetical protein